MFSHFYYIRATRLLAGASKKGVRISKSSQSSDPPRDDCIEAPLTLSNSISTLGAQREGATCLIDNAFFDIFVSPLGIKLSASLATHRILVQVSQLTLGAQSVSLPSHPWFLVKLNTTLFNLPLTPTSAASAMKCIAAACANRLYLFPILVFFPCIALLWPIECIFCP